MVTYAVTIEGECIDLYHALKDAGSYVAAFPAMFVDMPLDVSVPLVDTEFYTVTLSRTD